MQGSSPWPMRKYVTAYTPTTVLVHYNPAGNECEHDVEETKAIVNAKEFGR